MSPRLLSLPVFAVLLGACATPGGPKLMKNATLEEKIEQTRQYLGTPGVAVVIKQNGQTILARGFGVADTRNERLVTPDTVFRVGSLAKPLVGVVVLQLADEGRLKLDDPISRYVAGVPNGENITLRMLGMHTSGLFNYIGAKEVKAEFAARPTRRWTADELLRLSFAHPPHFTPPGEGFVYSNTNTLLLARVVKKITGRSVEAEIERRVIVPLGLTSTRFTEALRMPPNSARGYQYGTAEGPIYWKGAGTVLHDVTADSPSKWGSAGNLLSSARDLARFNSALASGKLLSPAMRAEQTRWRKTGYPIDYSYGFQLSKYQAAIGHSGQVNGFQSCIGYLPDEKLEISVCTNLYSSPNHEGPGDWIFFIIAEHFTGQRWQYHF